MRDERTLKDVCGEATGDEGPRHFYVGVSTGRYLRSHCDRIPYISVYSNPGGYCHIWAILVCAAVKGMVFKQFTLG